MNSRIQVLTHSSIRICGDRATVYVDPFQVKEEFHDADLVLVTHDHFDHFSPEDIAKVSNRETILAAPEPMRAKAEEARSMVGEILTANPGDFFEAAGVPVTMVRAYNVGKKFHPKEAGWAGYLIDIDGERIYVAGDTDINEDNKKIRCDIALVPIGGTYTMTAPQAAELINTIRPRLAIPTHYGSVAGAEEDAKEFAKLVKAPIEVKIIKQY